MSSALDDALDNASFESLSPDTPDDGTEPKRTRRQRSDKGVPRTGGTRRTTNKQLTEDLLVPWALFAQGAGMMVPTVSAVMLERGEKTVGAFVSIAGKHPAMLAAMKKASVIGPGIEIANTLMQMLVAGAMDLGRIPPEHPMAAMTGVAELYAQVHPDMFEQTAANSMPWGPAQSTPPPGPFTFSNPAGG